jgi:hypothetical protein
MVTATVQIEHERDRGGRQRPEDRDQHDQDDRQVPALRGGDVVLGAGLRRRPQRALADDVEPDPAVLGLAGLVALDPIFCRS